MSSNTAQQLQQAWNVAPAACLFLSAAYRGDNIHKFCKSNILIYLREIDSNLKFFPTSIKFSPNTRCQPNGKNCMVLGLCFMVGSFCQTTISGHEGIRSSSRDLANKWIISIKSSIFFNIPTLRHMPIQNTTLIYPKPPSFHRVEKQRLIH